MTSSLTRRRAKKANENMALKTTESCGERNVSRERINRSNSDSLRGGRASVDGFDFLTPTSASLTKNEVVGSGRFEIL